MPQDDVAKKLAGAKNFLAQSYAKFPKTNPAPAAAKPAAPAPSKPTTMMDEVKGKADMVQKAKTALNVPNMHKGGTVSVDGIYNLKAGEHVLTAKEATRARKHVLMASGMKSLAMAGEQQMKSQAKTPAKKGNGGPTTKKVQEG